uniref:Uncharacterized protein n=1 Tax=Arundo donax TaxID=35708 RepID=A0A0A9BZ12_ARUDO
MFPGMSITPYAATRVDQKTMQSVYNCTHTKWPLRHPWHASDRESITEHLLS